jgi:hypothetical protein
VRLFGYDCDRSNLVGSTLAQPTFWVHSLVFSVRGGLYQTLVLSRPVSSKRVSSNSIVRMDEYNRIHAKSNQEIHLG